MGLNVVFFPIRVTELVHCFVNIQSFYVCVCVSVYACLFVCLSPLCVSVWVHVYVSLYHLLSPSILCVSVCMGLLTFTAHLD